MSFGTSYGRLDRILHRIAFRAGMAQQAIADVEGILYRDTLSGIALDDPVFITALPRSGTTILLQILCRTGRFASHTYRDMPFVLCPMLWNRFSRRFAVDQGPRERAHGDGLEVSSDSPEAFEEMVWKRFWPDHYRGDRIRPWGASDHDPEFEEFLEAHMRKVIALRREGPGDERRYVSKNNLNIARLSALPAPLRLGVLLVPFRDPIQHAASMLLQHRRFSRIQERDDFARIYMEAIGHHEFGRGLKPVDFGGWLRHAPSPDGLEFWLRYWVAAYRHVLEHLDGRVRLLSYARLTEAPEDALTRLAGLIQVPSSDLVGEAHSLRFPRTHKVEDGELPEAIFEEARALYARLEKGAAV